MSILNNQVRLHSIRNTRFRTHLVAVVGLTPLFAVMAIWGWYANVGEVESLHNDPVQSSGDLPDLPPVGETDSVAALGASPAPPAAFSSISVGLDHSCGVLTYGAIACWGRNAEGQATPPDGEFKAVSAGAQSSCGIRADDTVACWGRGISGTPEATKFRSVSVHWEVHFNVHGDNACGVTLAGEIMCWSGDIANQPPPHGSFQLVSVGNGHACALRSDATLYCWGRNEHGQATPPSGAFQHVSAGSAQTCGLRVNGLVTCWGADWSGRSSPPSGAFRHVATLWDFSCGVRADGSVTCWGYNGHGQLHAPTGDFQTVGVGDGFACALKMDATVVCWGRDHDGRATPPPAKLMAPANVRANPVDSRSALVDWDHQGGAAGFIIIAVNVADPSRVVSAAVNNADARSHAIANLTAGQEYNIYVAAFRSVEEFEIDLTQKARVRVETIAASPTPAPTAPPLATSGDYDGDNDGLIEISRLSQLDAMRHDLDGDGSASHPDHAAAFPHALAGMGCPEAICIGYELTADLNFDTNGSGRADDGDAYWTGGWGWTPIGDPDEAFRWNATFDGNGHTISNLFIDWGDTDFVGLFRAAGSGSAIRNVGLEAVNVTGNSRVGGLVGGNRGAVSNCHATGQVTGNGNYVGGLVGHIGEGGSITASYGAGNVNGEGNNVGGLVGSIANNVAVTASYATGAVSGENYVGGLVGSSSPGSAITAGYAMGNVTGRYNIRRFRSSGNVRSVSDGENVGGLAGYSDQTAITSSYARGSVNGGDTAVGGLVGGASAGTVTNSYSAISGASHHAGGGRLVSAGVRLIGSTTGGTSVSDSYWDTNLSGASGPGGKTSRELQSPTANTGIYANWNPDWWDFGTPRQYPVLKYSGLDVARQRS